MSAAPEPVAPPARPEPGARAALDRITSLVLSAHTTADRPLGFEQVVDLCGGRVTREQVRHASSVLCRAGDLDRIRTGVYQWSGGTCTRMTAPPARELRLIQPPTATPPPPEPEPPAHTTAAALFDQISPTSNSGPRLTEKLTSDANTS